jgi:thiamine transporter 2/3
MVAKRLAMDSFGLIFGINTMIALVVQTIMTIAVVQNKNLLLTPREQQLIFGIYFTVLSAIFLVTTLIKFIIVRKRTRNSKV